MCYRPNGGVHACGAEAEALEEDISSGLLELTEDGTKGEDLTFVRRCVVLAVALPNCAPDTCGSFKLHLRPKSVGFEDSITKGLPPLPPDKSVVDVFADFLKYMFECAKKYIIDSHAIGKGLWKRLRHDLIFVLTHPNGWEGPQQAKMREAAIMGGLVPNAEAGTERIHFISEGEASVHYCVRNGMLSSDDGVCVARNHCQLVR